jgi:ABC-2 type transport system permease protein
MNANVNIDSSTDMSREPNPNASAVSTTLSARIRPFYWSVRRELWENRSIYIAPAAVAALVLVSALINIFRIPEGAVPFQRLQEISPQYLRMAGISLYGMVSVILAITAGIVGWFYCLDALYSERRERSVLFWKSLPISDTTTVLSKVLIGMGIVPLVALVAGIVLYLLLLIIASIVLMANGVNGTLLFANSGMGEALLVHVYAALAAILWCAPLYAWAIFVSSWVRRATFLWALLPPAAIALVEGLAFGTQHFMTMMGQRFSGGLQYAFVESAGQFEDDDFMKNPDNFPDSLLSLLDPARFFSQPGLWIGLAVAAAFIAASIWMRRYREPL